MSSNCDDEAPRIELKAFSKAILDLCGNTERQPEARNRIWLTKLARYYGPILRPGGKTTSDGEGAIY